MTNLTNLINFHTDLTNVISKLSIDQIINEKISIINSIDTTEFIHPLTTATNNYQQIKIDNQNIINDLNNLILTVEQKIDAIGNEIIEFQKQNRPVVNQFYSLGKRDIVLETVKNVILSNTLWQYPGLILYPHSKTWIDLMVAGDPLYLLVDVNLEDFNSQFSNISTIGADSFSSGDQDIERLQVRVTNQLLENLIKEYPEQYQRRLRIYQDIDLLPQNQFGMILAWDFLTYFSIDDIDAYLSKFLSLLRPGGILLFNYNNCDISSTAAGAEKNINYYFNKRRLKKMCNNLGFKIIRLEDEYQLGIPVSWAEIQKSGELITVKRAQAIGAILSK